MPHCVHHFVDRTSLTRVTETIIQWMHKKSLTIAHTSHYMNSNQHQQSVSTIYIYTAQISVQDLKITCLKKIYITLVHRMETRVKDLVVLI